MMIRSEKIAKAKESKKVFDDPEWYKNLGKSILKFLKSRFFAILISFLLVLLQTVHPAKVMLDFGYFSNNYINGIYCYFFALFIELFVMYYVLKKNKKVSGAFAVFSMVINLFYYFKVLVLTSEGLVWSWNVIPAAAFSIMIPYSIYRLAEEIN